MTNLTNTACPVAVESTGGATIMRLYGDIDMINATTCWDTIQQVLQTAPPPRAAVLDLQGVTLLTAAGVHVLDDAATLADKRGIRVRLVVDPRSQVRRVLDLVECSYS
jgi:anti-anti-sigma factor